MTELPAQPPRGPATATSITKPRPKPKRAPAKKKRVKRDPVKTWTNTLKRYRPNLMFDTLDALQSMYGLPEWKPYYDPTSELVLTMLSANSADINAEKAFDALCRHWPVAAGEQSIGANRGFRPGWGGVGIEEGEADWAAIADAPLDELIDVIRPGGLAPTKAPRIQAVLRKIFEERGDFSLEFLRSMSPAEALAWLTQIPGIGRKTASVVLLFSFGMPLMPVDRHIERVTRRIGLIPPKATVEQAHDYLQVQLADERVHEAHVNLITHGRQTCHALRPACGRCAIASRCRYINPKAP
jgi:endonuclease-3